MGSSKPPVDAQKALARLPASDVKRRGWRGIMRTVHASGPVLVTNHEQAEAVILTPDAYQDLLERATRNEPVIESDLALLRRRFDERLAALRSPDAATRLRAAMRGGARLRGKVKAGDSD
jgi:hypothetical protein